MGRALRKVSLENRGIASLVVLVIRESTDARGDTAVVAVADELALVVLFLVLVRPLLPRMLPRAVAVRADDKSRNDNDDDDDDDDDNEPRWFAIEKVEVEVEINGRRSWWW
mmetsp:Transcript_13250/g.37296  ORF Transcript_13250/g.37296 Transcript_13250/m.37296 type:complete len:111 (-) Transcript_13250:618-950(-)